MSTTRRPEPRFSSALVTGASGFFGRALVRQLLAAGVEVTCASYRARPDLASGPRWISGDIGDVEFVRKLVASANAEAIFNLAGQVTGSRDSSVVEPTLRVNLVGSVNILSAAVEHGCQRVVLIGSCEEPSGDDPPCSPYAAAKAGQAGYAAMFHELYGTPVTTARVFMGYGPDQPDRSKVVAHSITSLLHGDPPALSSGRRRCDWIYIDDVVDALIALAEAPAAIGKTVDVGTGVLHTVQHVVNTIVELTGASVRPRWGALADRPIETERVADVTVANELFGWQASTDLRTGLARTVDWFVDEQVHSDL